MKLNYTTHLLPLQMAAALMLAACAGHSIAPPAPSIDSAIGPTAEAMPDERHRKPYELLYVLDGAARTISVYAASRPAPVFLRTIQVSARNPIDLASDGQGNIYVLNIGARCCGSPYNSVEVYARGGTQPIRSLPLPSKLFNGGNIGVAADGTIYIIDANGNFLYELIHGRSPAVRIPVFGGDSGGPIYSLIFVAVGKGSGAFFIAGGGSCCGSAVAHVEEGSSNVTFPKNLYNATGPLVIDSYRNIAVWDPAVTNANQPSLLHVVDPHGVKATYAVPDPSFDLNGVGRLAFDGPDGLLYFGAVDHVSIMNYTRKAALGHIDGFRKITGIAISPQQYYEH